MQYTAKERQLYLNMRMDADLKFKMDETILAIKRHEGKSETIQSFVSRAISKEIAHQEHLMNAKRNISYEESRRRYMEEEKQWDE